MLPHWLHYVTSDVTVSHGMCQDDITSCMTSSWEAYKSQHALHSGSVSCRPSCTNPSGVLLLEMASHDYHYRVYLCYCLLFTEGYIVADAVGLANVNLTKVLRNNNYLELSANKMTKRQFIQEDYVTFHVEEKFFFFLC